MRVKDLRTQILNSENELEVSRLYYNRTELYLQESISKTNSLKIWCQHCFSSEAMLACVGGCAFLHYTDLVMTLRPSFHNRKRAQL